MDIAILEAFNNYLRYILESEMKGIQCIAIALILVILIPSLIYIPRVSSTGYRTHYIKYRYQQTVTGKRHTGAFFPITSTTSGYIVGEYHIELSYVDAWIKYKRLDTNMPEGVLGLPEVNCKANLSSFYGILNPVQEKNPCSGSPEIEVKLYTGDEVEAQYVYEGIDTYKGYPVVKVKSFAKVRSTRHYFGQTVNAKSDASTETYVYIGFPITLYQTARSYGTVGLASSTIQLKTEMLEADFPRRLEYKVIKIGDIVLIAGALGKACLYITGYLGEYELNITNTCSGIASIIIINQVKIKYKASYRGTHNLGILFTAFTVAPWSTKIIVFQDPLTRDVSKSIVVFSKEEIFPYFEAFLFGIIVSVSVIATVGLIIRFKLSSIREEEEIEPTTIEEAIASEYKEEVSE